MSDKKVQKLVVSALMAALTYVATMVVQIPSPMNGYVNLGDCAVLLAALALSGCGSRQTHEEYLIPKGPAVGFESPEFFTEHLAPRNQDLQSWREMAPTVRKSLRYVKSKPAGAVAIDRPGLRLTWGDMERTLLRLQELPALLQVRVLLPEQELLRWAAEQPERYILEDDYDSEFRFVGRPIPTLFSVSENQRVIYLNTFSKTIAPSIRISYMILPPQLLARYRERLGFYACTVSSFEQYTLARFLEQGRYEQHLNRMRTRYRQKRDAVIDAIGSSPLSGRVEVWEQDAGLHFLMHLHTELGDDALRQRAEAMGLRLALLSDYYSRPDTAPQHILVVNYAGIDMERLPEGLRRLAQIWEEPSCMTN